MPIRVMHVYKDLDEYSGLSELLLLLAERLDARRFSTELCLFRYSGSPAGREFERLGGRIHSLGVRPGPVEAPRTVHRLYRLLRAQRPDIVQTHVLRANLLGVLCSRAAKVPAVIATEMTLRDASPTLGKRLRDRFLQPACVAALRLAHGLLVTSKEVRAAWDGSGRVRTWTLHPCFNERKLADAGERSRKGGAYRIGYAGRLSEEKGLAFLIEAYARVAGRMGPSELLLIGCGPQERALRDLASNLEVGERVRFSGFRPNAFSELKNLDLFVLPSRSEGASVAMLEAMAVGLPIIATNVGGTPELLEDGETGRLIPFGDVEGLAGAIEHLYLNPNDAARLGERAREVAFGRFGPERFVAGMERIYDELMGVNACPRLEVGA